MSTTMATAVLAVAPILTVLALMLVAGWSAARAGSVGLVLALGLATLAFDVGENGALMVAGVAAEAAFITATILWILWPALTLHQMQQNNGALDALRAAVCRLTHQPMLQVLLIGWCLSLFLEGAAGFGTPVALVAPLLAGLGVPPLQSVVLALLGHAIGVSFGALGTPVAAQSTLTGLSGDSIAWRTALLNAGAASLMMVYFVRTFRTTLANADVDRTLHVGRWAALTAASFTLPAVCVAFLIGPALPTLVGALVAGLVLAMAIRYRADDHQSSDTSPDSASLAHALAPYFSLTLLVFATRLLPDNALTSLVLHWRLWEDYRGQIQPLGHPGTLLVAALLAGTWIQSRSLRPLAPALTASGRRLLPVAAALFAMLCLSRWMLHSGMIAALQAAAVESFGRGWPLLAPTVGALGSFVTGSATASNVLFSTLQTQTATALGLSSTWMAAGQTAGAAIGNIICPHNIVAGAATVGLAGREADILRRTLVPCLASLVLLGLMLVIILNAVT